MGYEPTSDKARFLVQAFHPHTGAPIAGVVARGLLADEHDEIEIGPLTTDENGEIEIVRSSAKLSGAVSVDIEATWRGTTREVSGDLYLKDESVLPGTDRKLYRPGQTVHVRGLWLDARRRPIAGEDVKIEIAGSRLNDAVIASTLDGRLAVAEHDVIAT